MCTRRKNIEVVDIFSNFFLISNSYLIFFSNSCTLEFDLKLQNTSSMRYLDVSNRSQVEEQNSRTIKTVAG